MVSKQGRQVKDYFGISKKIDVSLLKNLIALIDGYEVNYFGDPAPFDKPIRAGKLGKEVLVEWKEIQRALMRIATTVRSIPKIKMLITAQSILRPMSTGFSIGAILLLLTGGYSQSPEITLLLTFTLLLIGSMFIVASGIAGRKVAREIETYFDEHKLKYRFVRQYLRLTTQKLLYTLSHYLKETGENPQKHAIKLYKADYEGIRVLKKPGWFRNRYIVIVELGVRD